jgi:hypothetical protein
MRKQDILTKVAVDEKYFESLLDIIEGKKVIDAEIRKTLLKEGRALVTRCKVYNERKYLRLDKLT